MKRLLFVLLLCLTAASTTFGAPVSVPVGPTTKTNSVPVVPATNIDDGTYIGDIKFGESLPAGSANIGKVQPFSAMIEGGFTEIIDRDDSGVAASQYSKSVSKALGSSISGEIKSICVYSTEVGTGAVQTPGGRLMVFDADPTVASSAATLAAGDHELIIGVVDITSADWSADTTAAVTCSAVSIPFHSISTLYFVFRAASDATTINSDAGDDEEVSINFWYRRES